MSSSQWGMDTEIMWILSRPAHNKSHTCSTMLFLLLAGWTADDSREDWRPHVDDSGRGLVSLYPWMMKYKKPVPPTSSPAQYCCKRKKEFSSCWGEPVNILILSCLAIRHAKPCKNVYLEMGCWQENLKRSSVAL